jgi:hypothetical protein
MSSAISGHCDDRLGSLGTNGPDFGPLAAQNPLGGDQRAAILFIIAANNCRGISTSAI